MDEKQKAALIYAENLIRQSGYPGPHIPPAMLHAVARSVLAMGTISDKDVPKPLVLVKVTVATKRNDCFPWGGWQYDEQDREPKEEEKEQEQKQRPSEGKSAGNQPQQKKMKRGRKPQQGQPNGQPNPNQQNPSPNNPDNGKDKSDGKGDARGDGDEEEGDESPSAGSSSPQNDRGGGDGRSDTGSGSEESEGEDQQGDSDDSDGYGANVGCGKGASQDEDGIPTVSASYTGINIESYGDHRLETYDTFDDFINAADDSQEDRSNWKARASRDEGKEEWTGTQNFDEAVYLARVGWPEGVIKLDQIADHYHQLSKWTVDKSRSLDVAGTYPIVPIFLGGDPACMVNDGEMNRGLKPMMQLVVNRGYSWLTTPERIFNFGAAIMVCIDQIETIGPRIELVVATANMGDLFGGVQERPVWVTMTTIKRAQEHVEKNRLAYALAHPAYSRRLKYSILEQIDNYEEPFHWGYGKPIPLPPDLIEPGAIYIPQLESWENTRLPIGMSVWDDITTAVAEMQKHLGIAAQSDGRIEMLQRKEAA